MSKVKDYMYPADQRDEVLDFVKWLADKKDTSDYCGFDEVVDEPEDNHMVDMAEASIFSRVDE